MYFVEKEINKIVFVIISFILGPIGVDRFIRGQVGIGIFKLLTIGGVWGILWIVDFIIAITKLGKYKENFIFREGFYCSHCKSWGTWNCPECGSTGNTTDVCLGGKGCYKSIAYLNCSCNNRIKFKTGIWLEPINEKK